MEGVGEYCHVILPALVLVADQQGDSVVPVVPPAKRRREFRPHHRGAAALAPCRDVPGLRRSGSSRECRRRTGPVRRGGHRRRSTDCRAVRLCRKEATANKVPRCNARTPEGSVWKWIQQFTHDGQDALPGTPAILAVLHDRQRTDIELRPGGDGLTLRANGLDVAKSSVPGNAPQINFMASASVRCHTDQYNSRPYDLRHRSSGCLGISGTLTN